MQGVALVCQQYRVAGAADYDQAAVVGIGEAFEDGAALRRGGLFVPLADHDQGWRGDFRR